MAYKVLQKDEEGVLREVKIRGETVHASDFDVTMTEVKAFDDDTRSFTALATSGLPDRVEDIVDIKGWELDNFINNPVGMWAHDYSQLPIFRVTDIDIKPRSKKMFFRANFDDHEFADKVYNSYRKGFMKGFSVGFIPLDYELRDREQMTDEEKQRAGYWGGMHFKRQELLEISSAPIPMHPDALAGMKSMGLPHGMPNFSGTVKNLPSGELWVPIKNPTDFENISTTYMDKGVKVVSGNLAKEVDVEKDGMVVATPIGYIFSGDFDIDKVYKWLVSKGFDSVKVTNILEEKEPLELESTEEGFSLQIPVAVEPEPDTEPEVEEEPSGEILLEFDSITEEDLVEEPDPEKEPDAIVPETVRLDLDANEIVIDTNYGCLVLQAGEFGIELREGEIVTVENRKQLQDAISKISKILEIAGPTEPAPEPQVQQSDESDFSEVEDAVLASLEEARKPALDWNQITEVVQEVLTDALGGMVTNALGDAVSRASGKDT